jgi:hypothetical protein
MAIEDGPTGRTKPFPATDGIGRQNRAQGQLPYCLVKLDFTYFVLVVHQTRFDGQNPGILREFIRQKNIGELLGVISLL